MKIKITIDKFCSRKGLKDKMTIEGHIPTAKEIYEFLGGRDFEVVDKIMRKEI